MESAFTAPYHFVNQAELSCRRGAIIGVDYPPRNAAAGLTHLAFMNVPYLLTVSPEMTQEVLADPRADLVAKIDDVSIFRVSGAEGYVQVARNMPLKVKTDNWRSTIVPWYKNVNALPVPMAWDREQELDQFQSINASQAADPPAVPIEAGGEVLSEQVENDRITFETTTIGVPHLIKVSYFPQLEGRGRRRPLRGLAVVHDGDPDSARGHLRLRPHLEQRGGAGVHDHRMAHRGGRSGG